MGTTEKGKIDEQRREALALALEWIAPIESSVTEATLMASAFITKDISEDEFRQDWPNLVSALARRDIPARLNVLLPPNAYKLGTQIIRQLHELYILCIRSQGAKTMEKWEPIYGEYLQRATELDKTLADLKSVLTEEYMKTFN